MSEIIKIVVSGKCEPRGSKIAVALYDRVIEDGKVAINPESGKPKMKPRLDKHGRVLLLPKDDNPRSDGWMRKVNKAARQVMQNRRPLEGPIELTLRFYLARPQYHFGTGRNAGVVKDRYRHARHIVKPDRLKLARAVEDALSTVLYADDSQTVGGPVDKFYCDLESEQRVEIEVVALPYLPEEQRSLLEQFTEAETTVLLASNHIKGVPNARV